MSPKLFNSRSLLLLAIAILLNIHTVYPLGWYGNELRDLEWSGSSFVYSEAAYWSASSLVDWSVKYSVCAGNYILGGYNVLDGSKNEYFQRTYTGLPAHNQINLSFLFFPIDSWDGSSTDDHFEVSIDGYVYYGWRLSAFAEYAQPLCGGGWNDFPPIKIKMTFPHTASTVTMRVINQLDQGSTDESMGFRDVSMTFVTVASPSYSKCGTSDDSKLPIDWCPCQTTKEYMNPPNSGICFPCYSTCKTCHGGFYYECDTCDDGRYLSGGQCPLCNSICATCNGGAATNCLTCPTNNKYMLNGNTCVPTCDSPLVQTVSGVNTHCTTPCPGSYVLSWDSECYPVCSSMRLVARTYNTFLVCDYPCAVDQYLYWDGTCGNTCFFPLVIRVFHNRYFCDFPCTASQYLYWNNTCQSTCSYPLVTSTDRGMYRCEYPCSGAQYLYWNGSCIATCNSPLSSRIEGSARFCDYNCATSEYLYWDATCSTSCTGLLTAKSEGSPMVRNFCLFPCSVSTQYLYWNSTCAGTCNAPLTYYTSHSRYFCQYPCSVSDYLYWNGSCKASCPSPLVTRLEASLNYCDYPCTGSDYLYWNGSCISTCISPLKPRVTAGNNFCDYPCLTSEYLYWNTSCKSSCSFPLSSRTEASRHYCDYPCTGSNYLYWNGSCIASCNTPFTQRIDDGNYFCDYRCLASEYLYWDSMCLSTCDSPLITTTEGNPMVRNFCIFPCTPTQYLYWNGTCATSCNFPLSQRTQNSRYFCSQPCDPDKYLYWNGSCISTCPYPLSTRTEGSRGYCDYPCQTTEYLYWNGSCKASCNSPLNPRTVNGNNFCDYPCNPSLYLYWDGSCIASCSAPLTAVSEGIPMVRNYCLFKCTPSQYLYWNGSCINTCSYPLSWGYSNSRYYCYYPCAANQYLFWNASCLASCPYPHITRVEDSKNYCDYPCTGSQVLYWNGSCIVGCNSPLLSRSEGGKSYCDYPCQTSQYLYWNTSCKASCSFPLSTRTEGSRNFCDYPCTGSQYLYWNGSCVSTCVVPLLIRIDAGKQYCDYPCQSNQILYWDGSCTTQCSLPRVLVTEGSPSSRSYCRFPCTSSQFLYWNGTCSSTCPFPLTGRPQNSRLFCNYPCDASKFLYWNGSCLDSCAFPLSSRVDGGLKYCDYPCTASQFLSWNGTCSSACNPQLVQRVVGTNKFCDFPCSNSTDFLHWEGTCSSECVHPLTQVTEGTVLARKYCNFTCSASEYLYWNGTCSSNCLTPLQSKAILDRQICQFPCDPSKYLRWDGTCSSSCTFPLASKLEKGLKYCNFPCKSSEFLYWNGTCSATCHQMFVPRADNNLFYCDFPCEDTEYLYWNTSCLSQCPSPFKTIQEGASITRKFCNFACNSGQYLSWNNSCISTCDAPLITRISTAGTYCDLPCANSSHYYYVELGACKEDCQSSYIIDKTQPYLQCLPKSSTESGQEESEKKETGTTLFSTFFEAPVQNGTLTLVKVVKAMQYLRYLDIKLPPRLERLGLSQGRGIISFQGSRRMLTNNAEFLTSSIPSVFAKHGYDNNFIVNYWGTFIFIIVAVGLAVVFTLLEKVSEKMRATTPKAIFMRFRVIMRWNLVIMLLATSIDDVVLYTSIELRALNSSSNSTTYVSLVLSIIFCGLELAIMAGTFLLVRKKLKDCVRVLPENYNTPLTKFEIKWQDVQVIFRGFKETIKSAQFFYLIYMLRLGIPMLVTVCSPGMPLLIVITQVLTSILIIGYLLIKRPFKKMINQVQLLMLELIVMLMNICMLLLTIFHVMSVNAEDVSVVLGDIVILGNDIINLLALIFLAIRLLMEGFAIGRYLKSTKGQADKTVWIQLLALVFQQLNMGFEEVIEDYSYSNALAPSKAKGVKNNVEIMNTGPDLVEQDQTGRNVFTTMNENKSLITSDLDINNKEDAWIVPIVRGSIGTSFDNVGTPNQEIFKKTKSRDITPIKIARDDSVRGNDMSSPLDYTATEKRFLFTEGGDTSNLMEEHRDLPSEDTRARDTSKEIEAGVYDLHKEEEVAESKKGSQPFTFRHTAAVATNNQDQIPNEQLINEEEEEATIAVITSKDSDANPFKNKLLLKKENDELKLQEKKSYYDQPVANVNTKKAGAEKAKKFLNYNWKDMSSPGTSPTSNALKVAERVLEYDGNTSKDNSKEEKGAINLSKDNIRRTRLSQDLLNKEMPDSPVRDNEGASLQHKRVNSQSPPPSKEKNVDIFEWKSPEKPKKGNKLAPLNQKNAK